MNDHGPLFLACPNELDGGIGQRQCGGAGHWLRTRQNAAALLSVMTMLLVLSAVPRYCLAALARGAALISRTRLRAADGDDAIDRSSRFRDVENRHPAIHGGLE